MESQREAIFESRGRKKQGSVTQDQEREAGGITSLKTVIKTKSPPLISFILSS